ncbi:MAG: 5'-nucleotidase C-terminal domain-containing protein [Treponema sp.]|nr:5'-nucleotidase C-terminal domain-containing protein [Treponema sp.]
MKNFKRILSLLVIAATVGLMGCAGGARPVQREAGRVYELVLLHTNDHHGATMPVNGRGGLAERATFVRTVREANPNVLLLDAGDLNTGSALSNMFSAEPDILAYNLMGYDAMVFGNHEFSGGRERLERQIALADFPFFSSNIRTAGGGFLGGHQYLVRNFEGFRVGILGITTLRTLDIHGEGDAFINSLDFIPEIQAARDAVNRLRNRERVDIVIALVHLGDVRERDGHVISPDLAAAVPGIDIIVDGHSHSRFDQPMRVGDTLIVTAHEWGRYVGKASVSIVDGRITGFDWELVEIGTHTFAPDAEVMAMLTPFLEQADASLGEVVGQAADTFVFGNRLPRYQETAIGNMIADGMAWYMRNVLNQTLDFAFVNGGNIRAELPAGELTREHILTVLPFTNFLHVVSLTGSEIIELFEFIATIPQGNGGFPQFSAEVRYTLNLSERTITNLTIGGVPVDPGRTYRFTTNDFLLAGGDGYSVLTRARDPFNTAMLMSCVVIGYIQARGTISPATDGRMVVVGGN